MRSFATIVFLLITSLPSFAREIKDTLWTNKNDRVIVTYDVVNDGARIVISTSSRPRIVPSKGLIQACKGDFDKLKVVVFDRIGDFGATMWKGLTPKAFMVPAGLSYVNSSEGYYILGENQPLIFSGVISAKTELKMTLYLAVYEKKQSYQIYSVSKRPLTIDCKKLSSRRESASHRVSTHEVERVLVHSSEELEADNEAITSALSSINLIQELLVRENEVPFSQALQMEIYNLRSIKSRITEKEVLDRLNEVLLQCADKERELKETQHAAALAERAEEHALMEQQKQEAAAQQKASEEKVKIQEEKQQKRTMWVIAGGVVLAILAFICNAVFRHFRDVRNQKSIMQMQESLARQAEHEASRRSQEIVRNKAHQVANKGRSKFRETLQTSGKSPKTSGKPSQNTNTRNNKRHSI